MSEDGIEVLLFDDGNGTRYAIPMTDLPNFRLPEGAEVDENDVEGFINTNPGWTNQSSAARVRGPYRYVPAQGWGAGITAPPLVK